MYVICKRQVHILYTLICQLLTKLHHKKIIVEITLMFNNESQGMSCNKNSHEPNSYDAIKKHLLVIRNKDCNLLGTVA